MKVLMFSTYFLTPVLERELEIVTNHMEKGDEVRIVRCTGQLRSCLLNPSHKKSICIYCEGKFDNGFELAKIPKAKIIELPKADYKPRSDTPMTFSDVEQLKKFQYEDADLGTAVASTLVWYFDKNPWFDTNKYSVEINTALNTAIFVFHSALALLDEHQPDIVYFFNGRHYTTRPVMRACQKQGVTCYTHERAGTFARYVLRKNTLPHDLDVLSKDIRKVWSTSGEDRREQGVKWFEERRARVEQTYLSFTRDQEYDLLPTGYDKRKRNIVIFNSTMEEQVGMPWAANRIYRDEVEGIRRICESLKDNEATNVYIRLHPNLAGEFKNVRAEHNTQLKKIFELENIENVNVIEPTSPVDSYALIDAATSVVVFGSTVGVEATYWGKASILAGSGAPYQSLDCCYKPETHEELVDFLSLDLLPKSRDETIKYAYYQMNYGVPYKKFIHDGVFSGLYNGIKVLPTIGTRLLAYFTRIMEIDGFEDLRALMTELKKMRTRS